MLNMTSTMSAKFVYCYGEYLFHLPAYVSISFHGVYELPKTPHELLIKKPAENFHHSFEINRL